MRVGWWPRVAKHRDNKARRRRRWRSSSRRIRALSQLSLLRRVVPAATEDPAAARRRRWPEWRRRGRIRHFGRTGDAANTPAAGSGSQFDATPGSGGGANAVAPLAAATGPAPLQPFHPRRRAALARLAAAGALPACTALAVEAAAPVATSVQGGLLVVQASATGGTSIAGKAALGRTQLFAETGPITMSGAASFRIIHAVSGGACSLSGSTASLSLRMAASGGQTTVSLKPVSLTIQLGRGAWRFHDQWDVADRNHHHADQKPVRPARVARRSCRTPVTISTSSNTAISGTFS